MSHDDPTLEQARDRYFEANGFGTNGGYDDAWVDFSLGPVPFPFPNSPARVKAVRFHDLHHVLTGYATSTVGEFEISGWELGAGCKGMVAAWVLNLGGLAAGLFVAPGRVARAFRRGLRDRSLYGEDYERLLAMRVSEARAAFLAGAADAGWTLREAILLAVTFVTGLFVGLSLFALLLPLAPVGFVTNALRARDRQLRPTATRQGGA